WTPPFMRRNEVGVEVDAAAQAPGAAAAWPGELVAAVLARAEEAVDRIDRQMAEAERLRAERVAATEAQQVADALAGHLAANRFEKWLLDEAIHQLVAGASQILGELSQDAYALAVDRGSGGFQVIDHTNASQARSARTLSGGETFLASLALALALADQVAGLAAAGAARLDALFLDEGFGTLDAETLDVVATALDELGARGRMVGVVTHVRELAERLPVRFEVRKVGGSATVERVAG
ncbi:MAG: SbcC/MukB-like Walker B domain-containing protein, partial [Acidimicrobiia bacterium]